MYTYSDELFSDIHKDAFGFRPKGDDYLRWNSLSADEKQAEWTYMDNVIARNEEADRIAQEKCIVILEKTISALIDCGAKTRETAIRWLADADNVGEDLEFLCYLHNVPYGYFGEKNV